MAEIRVEEKRSRTGIWIVLALILAALAAWWLLRNNSSRDALGSADSTSNVGAAAGATPTTAQGPVESFLAWHDGGRADTMGLDHRYTATGIQNLTDALAALGTTGEGGKVQDELRTLRSRADTLQQNPQAATHANHVRALFRSVSGVMSAMQQERFPGAAEQVKGVESAAQAIRADRLLLDQKTEVRNFFDKAAVAVRQMSESR